MAKRNPGFYNEKKHEANKKEVVHKNSWETNRKGAINVVNGFNC